MNTTDGGFGRREISSDIVAHYQAEGWWGDRSVVDDFLDVVAARPDATAIVSHRAGAADPERHTYAELELLSRRVAGALIDLGVEPGDIVSIQLPNSWEFPAIAYGVLRVGAIVSPLVPILRHRELDFILGRTGSRILFVPDCWHGFDHAALAAGLQKSVDSLEHVVVVGDATGDSIGFAEQMIGRRWENDPALASQLDARRPSADDLMQIQFTSGTTGEPKGVLHSHNTTKSGGRSIDEIFGLGVDDVCFMASTLAHVTGFALGMVKPLSMGMTIVYQDTWDADAVLDLIEVEGIAWTVSATPFAKDLIAAQQRAPHDLSSFKLFICGGAPIPPKVVEDARSVLDAELSAVWGMTENLMVTATRPGDPVELVSDSDGTPVDYMEIRIVDDDGTRVGVGRSGNLQVRGPSQALGYFRRPDLYAAASRDGDWFDTGDVARLRADSGIRIVGRTKDIIIRGGENIPVAEVEALLLRHPAVDDVAVVGLPDDRLGERGCAVVTVDGPPPTLGDLTSFLDEQGMAKQYWPERIEIVDELPRTPSGKVQKYKLREAISATPPRPAPRPPRC